MSDPSRLEPRLLAGSPRPNRHRHSYALTVTLLMLGLLVAGFSPAPAADWPQFRGPGQNGVIDGTGLFASQDFGLEVEWRAPLGSGYGGLTVSGERLYVMHSAGESDVLTAFEISSGNQVWRYRIGDIYEGHDGSDDGPMSTPVIASGQIFGLGPWGHLFALDLETGDEQWRIELDGESQSTTPVWGYATAPVVSGDFVIVLTGGPDGRAVTAFDQKTGEVRWSTGDGGIAYQSPIVAKVGGREQLVVLANEHVYGLDLKDGRELWRHDLGEVEGEGSRQPVVVADGRFLLPVNEESVLVEVTRRGRRYAVEELWRSRYIKRSHAIPVVYGDHIYGFNGAILTCLDPETGDVVWRSRTPGGLSLIVVDGHLVLTGGDGDLVVALASGEGYLERSRMPLFDEASWTMPAFADGSLFLRDFEHLVRVRVTDQPVQITEARPESEEAPALGLLADLERRVGAASDASARQALVDDFMAAQAVLPIVEDSGIVHVVYRGAEEDVAVVGSMTNNEERVLRRLADTDLFFLSFDLDAAGHWEYRLAIDYEDPGPDPNNPFPIGSLMGPSSELRGPRWAVPDFVSEPTTLRGSLDTVSFRSEIRDNERELRVYLPPGYEESAAERYPLLFVNNGLRALEMSRMDWVLDNLIGSGRMAPIVAVFLERTGGEYGGDDTGDYARMMAEELVPFIEERFVAGGGRERRAITGVGSGGTASMFAGLMRPETFGKVAAQSLYIVGDRRDQMWELAAQQTDAPRLMLFSSSNDYDIPEQEISAQADNAKVVEELVAAGVPVTMHLGVGAAGWGSWRASYDDYLTAFFPPAR